MIESHYWREELRRIATSLRPVTKPPRWSERLWEVTKRDVNVGFFICRRLIELRKVSDGCKSTSIQVYRCLNLKKATVINKFWIEEVYDLPNETPDQMDIGRLANQFIHWFSFDLTRGHDRNWSDFYIVSDYDKNKGILRVPVVEAVRALDHVANDHGHGMTTKWDEILGDYRITVT